ncbi:Flp family type IVb pilin [Pendulispora albinea]|uniref:Flp family type IVb pilin n=1 Tax=Pendulispora albinea TaxID=2741071 RepID=A0ABZ2M9X4_9BACT
MPTIPKSLLRDTRGVSTVEYAMILVAILLVISGGYRLLGKELEAKVTCASALDSACGGGAGAAGPSAGTG